MSSCIIFFVFNSFFIKFLIFSSVFIIILLFLSTLSHSLSLLLLVVCNIFNLSLPHSLSPICLSVIIYLGLCRFMFCVFSLFLSHLLFRILFLCRLIIGFIVGINLIHLFSSLFTFFQYKLIIGFYYSGTLVSVLFYSYFKH